MRQSIFITLSAFGLLVSGMTWAGPPDEQTDDQVTLEVPADTSEITEGAAIEVEINEAAPEPISFEEAMALCAYELEVQACIDEKTGQVRPTVNEPTDYMDSQAPVESEEYEESGDPMDELTDPMNIPMDSEAPECDLDANGMEDCPE